MEQESIPSAYLETVEEESTKTETDSSDSKSGNTGNKDFSNKSDRRMLTDEETTGVAIFSDNCSSYGSTQWMEDDEWAMLTTEE